MLVEKLPTTVFTALDDGGGVLLNLETLFYFKLNRTGVTVWREIDGGSPVAIEDLTHTLCRGFETTENVASDDVQTFVEHLEWYKLVKITN
jgi:hypothetical protein